jgi:hypothetical protein
MGMDEDIDLGDIKIGVKSLGPNSKAIRITKQDKTKKIL